MIMMTDDKAETERHVEDVCGACGGCGAVTEDLIVPTRIARTVDFNASLANTVTPYVAHVVLAGAGAGTTWPSDVAKVTAARIATTAAADLFEGRVVVSLAEPSDDIGSRADVDDPVDVTAMVFPHGVEATIDVNDIPHFLAIVARDTESAKTTISSSTSTTTLLMSTSTSTTKTNTTNTSSLTATPIRALACIFVCTHRRRDARCGAVGPLLLEAFRRHLALAGLDDRVRVFGCSHYGGHRFAGNCIIYHEYHAVDGVWYGRVTPQDVADVVTTTIIGRRIVSHLLRGRINTPPPTTTHSLRW